MAVGSYFPEKILINFDVNYLIFYQANKRIIDATANRMGIIDEKVLINIQ